MEFDRRPENGLKTIRVRLPEPLVERRRGVLSYARRVADNIPHKEIEAALIHGSWKETLSPLQFSQVKSQRGTTMERVILYNDTLWEMEEFINNLMLRGCNGGVRAFYSLLPGVY